MVAASLAALLLAGCLVDDDASAVCQSFLSPGQVGAADQEGGHGPRTITADVLLGDHVPAMAWWPGEEPGTVEVVRLRTSEGAHTLTIHARSGVPVGLFAGGNYSGNGQARWSQALQVPAGDDPVQVRVGGTLDGAVEGVWSQPVAQGAVPPNAIWEPHPMQDLAANLDRIETVIFTLDWENGMAGGADFGIALAAATGTFHYTNAAYQASLGPQQELRRVEASELAQLGWGNATEAQAGPSVSTGAATPTGLPYRLSWSATLRPLDGATGLVCEDLGPVRTVDVT